VRASDSKSLCPNVSHQLVDLWDGGAPALGLNNSASCEPQNSVYPVNASGLPATDCVYEDERFLRRVHQTIRAHDVQDTAHPLFLFWALRAHCPTPHREGRAEKLRPYV
jgi:hypothetical protein